MLYIYFFFLFLLGLGRFIYKTKLSHSANKISIFLGLITTLLLVASIRFPFLFLSLHLGLNFLYPFIVIISIIMSVFILNSYKGNTPKLLDYIIPLFIYLTLTSLLYSFAIYSDINIYECTIFFLSIAFGELSDVLVMPSIKFIWCHRSSDHKNPINFDLFSNKQPLGIGGEINSKKSTSLFMDNEGRKPTKDKGKRPAAFSPTEEEGSRWGSVNRPIEVSDGESDDSNSSDSSKGDSIEIEKEAFSSVSNSASSKSKRGPNLSVTTGNSSNNSSNVASLSKETTDGSPVDGTLVLNGTIIEPGHSGYLEAKAIFNKYAIESNPNRHEMDYPLSKATQQLVAYNANLTETEETTFTSQIDRDVLWHNRKVYRTDGPHPAEPQSAASVKDSDYQANYYREHGYFPKDEKHKTINYINAKNEEIKKEKINDEKINRNKNNDGDNNS